MIGLLVVAGSLVVIGFAFIPRPEDVASNATAKELFEAE